jgi:hypothetical protein
VLARQQYWLVRGMRPGRDGCNNNSSLVRMTCTGLVTAGTIQLSWRLNRHRQAPLLELQLQQLQQRSASSLPPCLSLAAIS